MSSSDGSYHSPQKSIARSPMICASSRQNFSGSRSVDDVLLAVRMQESHTPGYHCPMQAMEPASMGENAPSVRTIITWMQVCPVGLGRNRTGGCAMAWNSPPPPMVYTFHL